MVRVQTKGAIPIAAPPPPPPAAPPTGQFRNAQTAKGTMLGTMPVIDEEMIRKAQQEARPPTQVSGKGGAAPIDDDKDKK